MADPLSISASIASLVTIADCVFDRAFGYVKAVKNAPQEVRDLASSIGTLCGILHNLLLVARQVQGETFDTTIQIKHVRSCRLTIEKITKMLGQTKLSSDSGRMKTIQRFKWPFAAPEIKSLLAEIEQH